MKLNPPTKPRTAEDLLAGTLSRLCGAFEAYRNGPTGLEGSRRRKYVQSLLERMWVLEKRANAEKRPIKRFDSIGMEIDYRRAVIACGVDDAIVIGPTRPVAVVAFRWAWCAVMRERGYSLEQVARSLGRRSHSWLVNAGRDLLHGGSKSATTGREFVVRIKEALACPVSPTPCLPGPLAGPPEGSESWAASGGIVGAGNGSPITVMERMTV